MFLLSLMIVHMMEVLLPELLISFRRIMQMDNTLQHNMIKAVTERCCGYWPLPFHYVYQYIEPTKEGATRPTSEFIMKTMF